MTNGQTPPTTLKAIPTFRMTLVDYRKMEAALPQPQASKEDTDIVAGQRLGVQLALRYIRDNYLVS